MVNPKILCRKHLLGEHGEIHKHRWTFERKHKKDKYIANNCIEPTSMESRHEVLAREMKRRGFNHKSSFKQPNIDYLPKNQKYYRVDKLSSLCDLLKRCEDCKKRYKTKI